jgi:hypothetical protein
VRGSSSFVSRKKSVTEHGVSTPTIKASSETLKRAAILDIPTGFLAPTLAWGSARRRA